jgi:GntR family transcriptional repressor for pyruvate dehydrogenase complex
MKDEGIDMQIQPIKKVNISDQVYEQLKEQLITGVWKQGDKIPSENELVTLFNVSRVTVRQALSKLITLGLLETKLGEGTFVKEITPGVYMKEMIPYMYLNKDSYREVLEFRLVIEVETAGIAAEKITDQDIARLESCLNRMMELKNDLEDYVYQDLHFHMIIAKSTRNSLIIQVNNIVREIIRETIKNVTEEFGVEVGLKYHKLLIDSFKLKDAEMAKKMMREHLQQAVEKYN